MTEQLYDIAAEAFVDVPLATPTLAQRKASLKDRVKRIGDTKLTAGFAFDFGGDDGVQHLQLRDNTDRTNWLTAQAAYQAQVALGNGAVVGAAIRTAENDIITMSFADAYTMLLGMAAWGQSLYAVSWAKQDAIEAASDGDALDVIAAAINEAWPE